MKLLFALPGFHQRDRGAEVALLAIASELAKLDNEVTVVGSGAARPGQAYRYMQLPAIGRERFEAFPSFPLFRNETAYEDMTFAVGLVRKVHACDFDATLTCSFPFTHWALRRGRGAHVFVTQNGDWPAFSQSSEYRFFSCDGLVCTNPDYYERNRERWHAALVPNGIDAGEFLPGPAERARFELPEDARVVLMVSACIESKRVLDGVRAVALVPGAHLVVAGDGPMRTEVDAAAAELLPGRFKRLTLPADKMPTLYRSADVFLHLSKLESFGNVYVEALASGLPVVAHDTTRTRWIVGDEQFLTDTNSTESTASALHAALAADPALSASRRARAQRYGWDRIGVQYHDFLREVVARRTGSVQS
jgi:glycosyltransferase involved in cell wall biosynthesis